MHFVRVWKYLYTQSFWNKAPYWVVTFPLCLIDHKLVSRSEKPLLKNPNLGAHWPNLTPRWFYLIMYFKDLYVDALRKVMYFSVPDWSLKALEFAFSFMASLKMISILLYQYFLLFFSFMTSLKMISILLYQYFLLLFSFIASLKMISILLYQYFLLLWTFRGTQLLV